MNIQELLSIVDQKKGSDLHLVTNVAPAMRLNGNICPVNDGADIIAPEETQSLLKTLLSNTYQQNQFENNGDADIAYTCRSIYENKILRARVNVYRDYRGISFAFRLISEKIRNMQDLNLPLGMRNLIKKKHGFIAITGPTGSGKTTSLAAMINEINGTKPLNIITLEDPIEYIYPVQRALVSQREIGRDCSSFASGLKAALRQDPNIILVGEMRDPETIQTALMAAETGHLVLTTLHTANVIEAVDRILQYFPQGQQTQIQAQLAHCFEGIIAQQLLPKKNGDGRVAAFEVLLKTPATANLIRNGNAFQLKDYMRPEFGMGTMDASIKNLEERNCI
ncbi:MAG: type IV pilus twitching motility protein PilT [Proteocatella sp.]